MDNYYIPTYIPEYHIYDILYNDNNEFIIITPGPTPDRVIIPDRTRELTIRYDNQTFEVIKCKENHTFIYRLKSNYSETITLVINGNSITTRVNKYPEFPNDILLSTEVKDEDAYILQWIEYHKRLGVSRFILYDNSNNNTLAQLLNKHIHDKTVVLIKWTYPLWCTNPIKRDGQATQQNHSLYTFNNSKYIGFFDIDEYINLQKSLSIDAFFDNYIVEKNINVDNISSFRFLNKFFYNPNNLPTDGNNFLKIFNCDTITKQGREKNFALPKNAKTILIHLVEDRLMYTINPEDGYFNHYFFLNKADRGRDKTNLEDMSILKHII